MHPSVKSWIPTGLFLVCWRAPATSHQHSMPHRAMSWGWAALAPGHLTESLPIGTGLEQLLHDNRQLNSWHSYTPLISTADTSQGYLQTIICARHILSMLPAIRLLFSSFYGVTATDLVLQDKRQSDRASFLRTVTLFHPPFPETRNGLFRTARSGLPLPFSHSRHVWMRDADWSKI